jgi:GTP-binding protein
VEKIAVKRSLTAIQQADVAVLVLDVNDGVTLQDFRLSEKISDEGTACVIAVNKSDLIPSKSSNILFEKEREFMSHLRPIYWASVVFVSAKSGYRIKSLLQSVAAAGVEHRRRISTSTINLILSEAKSLSWANVLGTHRTRVKLHFGTQVAVRPPTFVIFVNNPNYFNQDLRKFIEVQIRRQVGYASTPIRIFWRGRHIRSESNNI